MNRFDFAEAQRRIAERKYHGCLSKVIRELVNRIKGIKTPEKVVSEIERFSRTKIFSRLADLMAERMATASLAGARKTWRHAAAESTKGREIHAAIKKETSEPAVQAALSAILDENSRLIRTVPPDMAKKLSRYAYELHQKGIRPEEIAAGMTKMAPHLTQAQVRRIARTEAAKAASMITEARCESLGVEWYIWRSCQDERTRRAHLKMTGILCRWNDPPNPEKLFREKYTYNAYHPGGIFNCRCIALPVIDKEDVQFPCKAHVGGKIVTVRSWKELMKMG